jgi:hypothetical protein
MMCEGAVVEKNAIYYMKKIIIVLIMSLVLNYLFQERKLTMLMDQIIVHMYLLDGNYMIQMVV